MSAREVLALREYLGPELRGRTISDAAHVVSLTDILSLSCLGGRVAELSNRSVLLSASGQLISALALIELDGIARRILLCPPDLNPDHVQTLIEDAGIEAIVTDEPLRWSDAGVYLILGAHLPERALKPPPRIERATEWLMLIADRSGVPKIVRHALKDLCGPILAEGPARGERPVWASFHDVLRDDGLQIFLRAVLGGGSMVLSEHGERLADHVARLSARGVTHISGTPSDWRAFLASGAAAGFSPRDVRLTGGFADQAVFDALVHAFPSASVSHDDASTEAQVDAGHTA
jgi:hypothetical protein